eukprot:TRINITY_DN7222_c0_g1_i1.p2 TRINITY_DN7222_c0_g1~~TRINITY_DN7222_c0_g1_i1.p2  ORF type:complete len:150 (-),score=65.29 TRINITY_DN7222_c0_g1_i1:102-551(-)
MMLYQKDEKITELEGKLEDCQQYENAILAAYNKEIEELNVQLEHERNSAKESLAALAELGKSQEEMFSNSIREVEQIVKDKAQEGGRKKELDIQAVEVKKIMSQPKRLTRNVTSLSKEPEQLQEMAVQKKSPPSKAAQPQTNKKEVQKK